MFRRGLLLLTAGVLAGACREPAEGAHPGGSASSATEAPVLGAEPRVLGMGELGRTPHFSASVDSVRECPMDPPFSPKRGFLKLGVELTLTGTTATEVPTNPFYATVVDPSGTTYAPTLAGCEPGLFAGRVAEGKSQTGYVTFEVPKAATRLELRYRPAIIGAKDEELRFSIRR